MNGTASTLSAWDALDALPPPTSSIAPSAGTPATPLPSQLPSKSPPVLLVSPPSTSSSEAPEIQIQDDSSICFSCPLNPTSPADVVLTPHVVSLVSTDRNGKRLEKEREPRVVAMKRFFPPKDKVSARATWWGYQVFLPHAIMLELGNDMTPVSSALTAISTVLTFIANQ
ncbi:hypothetical protein MNV49_002638 [Pseudohyphozyma bogoriensis]|nr:hypothetical protein MNV49_002638 [Pseudohyphozyma bogoriensis]